MRTARPLPRLSARFTALFLASAVCLGALHSGWDDPFCDPLPVHHDHNAHRIQAGRLPAPVDDHCVLCHSQRSLRSGLVAAPVALFVESQVAVLRPGRAALDGRIDGSTAASRAPPVSLL